MHSGGAAGNGGKRHAGSNLRDEKIDGDSDDDGEFSSLWVFFSFARDKRRFAWALLSILKNNIVTAPIYYVLVLVKYLELLFLYVVFAFTYYHERTSAHSLAGNFIKGVDSKI